MTDREPSNLRTLFRTAESQRAELDGFPNTISDAYQELLATAITSYEACLKLANSIALFSPNESLEDIASPNLEYLFIDFRLAQLLEKRTRGDRKQNVLDARRCYEKFLKLLDQYDVLSKADAKLYERYQNNPDKFETAGGDAASRRNTKIARFKEEKELKNKLEYLRRNPDALANDEDALRELHLTHIKLCVHETWQALEGMALELQILAMAPPSPPSISTSTTTSNIPDTRESTRNADTYSDRLDIHSVLSASNRGPLLSSTGKPLRPFTLLDKRTQLQQGVFRPDHNLPTMSIDEYLEEERRRGGIIEGGGAKSGIRPEPEEDDLDVVDREIEKQRRWDDWKDENPRGAGNTLNRG